MNHIVHKVLAGSQPRVLASCVRSQKRSLAFATRMLLEKHTIKVPKMGDSITEGTVVDWTVKVGQAVKVDDVIAMIETDKVTVEIKAEADGVVTQHFCKIDDTVEVGSPLYEIDSEAEATVQATSRDPEPATKTNTPPQPVDGEKVAAKIPQSAEKPKSIHRVPSIKFLGKEGWSSRRSPAPPVQHFVIPPNYGRPPFTEVEMEALMLGGANIAPYAKY